MENKAHYFKDVTLLVTHYNRSASLERILKAFKELNCSFEEIIVSDDASKPEHLNQLKALQEEVPFRLVSAPTNGGLGHNINKGQSAVRTPYTLYVQEDFVPTEEFAAHFEDGYQIMQTESEWDIIRFYAYNYYPYLKPYKKGFSEMLFKPWYTKAAKLHYYSDHPHLRRSNFLEKFGKYVEGKKPDRTEYLMCVRFLQKKGKGLFYHDFNKLFVQKNSSSEPSTWQQKSWKQSKNPFVAFIRTLYRQIKYNFDINFSGQKAPF
ncbi:MAG: glycosyltransferase [Hymenobacteraceae bacterium]|nr:glycosyltransferase [Hymenobacteraceae bacterium]